MYQIYADATLIYDSTLEDYKIAKGDLTLEAGHAGSFVFSVYPDHFFYDRFVKLKTVITVYKSGRIVFRGRVLNDATDYWNNKTLTCEGELSFLQDSVVRPFEFQGAHGDLFRQFIERHNEQVDEFKRFKIGSVTVVDGNDYINRSSIDYGPTLSTMASALTDSTLGGYFYVTHGDDGTDPEPTIHYVADFPGTATQSIEFGVNLRDYTKTVTADELATAIVPLGAESESDGKRTTIASANNGVDYVYNAEAVALRGWIFKTVVWEDVAIPNNLKKKAEAYLAAAVEQAVTIELNAIDLHLLDRSIESINVCEYVHVSSQPHGFDAVLLCIRQTLDLLNPERDTVTLGYQTPTFTDTVSQMEASVSTLGRSVSAIRQDAYSIKLSVENLDTQMHADLELTAEAIRAEVDAVAEDLTEQVSSVEQTAGKIQSTVSSHTQLISNHTTLISGLSTTTNNLQSQITQTANEIAAVVSAVDDSSGNVTAASIVAAINSAGSSVKISASHVEISGFVTFTDLSTSGRTTINAGNITTGSISADRISGGTLSGVVLESPGSRWWEDVSIHDGMVDFYSGYIMDSDAGALVMYAQNYLNFETGGVIRFYMPNGRYWELDGSGMNYYTASGGWINGFAFAN